MGDRKTTPLRVEGGVLVGGDLCVSRPGSRDSQVGGLPSGLLTNRAQKYSFLPHTYQSLVFSLRLEETTLPFRRGTGVGVPPKERSLSNLVSHLGCNDPPPRFSPVPHRPCLLPLLTFVCRITNRKYYLGHH